MKFLADENIEWPIVVQMRRWGHDIASVRELLHGGTDDAVLRLSNKEKRILLTNDSDFGMMVFNQMKESCGIILMRFSHESADAKIKVLKHLLKFHEKKLLNHFTVVSEGQIKIRPLM